MAEIFCCLSAMKALLRRSALLAAPLAVFAAASSSHAAQITLGGTDYTVSTIGPDSFNNLSATLTQQPWFGDAAAAEDAAIQVGTQLGFPVLGTLGPFFSWQQNTPSNAYLYSVSQTGVVAFNAVPTSRFITWAVATENVPVPGPLPVFGVATAFAVSRSLRKRIQAATDSTTN